MNENMNDIVNQLLEQRIKLDALPKLAKHSIVLNARQFSTTYSTANAILSLATNEADPVAYLEQCKVTYNGKLVQIKLSDASKTWLRQLAMLRQIAKQRPIVPLKYRRS